MGSKSLSTLVILAAFSSIAQGVKKDLVCPQPQDVGICLEQCSSDADCTGIAELCCSNGCGHECTLGVPATEFDNCDLECPEDFKCANYRPISCLMDDTQCEMQQTCVENDFLGCTVLDCAFCELQEVVCVTAPCYPVPECGSP